MTSKHADSIWAVFTVYYAMCVTLSLEIIGRYINVVLFIMIFGVNCLQMKP